MYDIIALNSIEIGSWLRLRRVLMLPRRAPHCAPQSRGTCSCFDQDLDLGFDFCFDFEFKSTTVSSLFSICQRGFLLLPRNHSRCCLPAARHDLLSSPAPLTAAICSFPEHYLPYSLS